MLKYKTAVLSALFIFSVMPVANGEEYKVVRQEISDPKVVFATVESSDVVAARARIGGTIISISVREGDIVQAGQEIAIVGDDKLALQAKTLDAQISGLVAQAEKANADLKREEALIDGGGVSKATLDSAKAAASAANNDLKARRAQRDLIEQEVTEGKILSPSYGRVLHVPLLSGSVVMPGESVATIAAEKYILRLSLPERHAHYLKKGDKIRLDKAEMSVEGAREGEISLVYPAIENGRVMADASVEDLNNYFVGQRVRVWVNTEMRPGFIIPKSYIKTKSGIDYVDIKSPSGKSFEIPVQCGKTANVDDPMIEILSGLQDGDILVKP